MTLQEHIRHEIEASREFFERSTRVLREEDSSFAPAPDMFTVAAHVAHASFSIDWMLEGAFGEGFNMDFEEHDRQARAITSLAQARRLLEGAYIRAIEATEKHSEVEWLTDFADGSIYSGPKTGIVYGIAEHSAHHRGALSVYARLIGLKPLMPYMEM